MPLVMLKSILTTILLVVAAFQALGMAQIQGHIRLLPVDNTRLVRWHRLGGGAALLLALAVATMCLLGERYA